MERGSRITQAILEVHDDGIANVCVDGWRWPRIVDSDCCALEKSVWVCSHPGDVEVVGHDLGVGEEGEYGEGEGEDVEEGVGGSHCEVVFSTIREYFHNGMGDGGEDTGIGRGRGREAQVEDRRDGRVRVGEGEGGMCE